MHSFPITNATNSRACSLAYEGDLCTRSAHLYSVTDKDFPTSMMYAELCFHPLQAFIVPCPMDVISQSNCISLLISLWSEKHIFVLLLVVVVQHHRSHDIPPYKKGSPATSFTAINVGPKLIFDLRGGSCPISCRKGGVCNLFARKFPKETESVVLTLADMLLSSERAMGVWEDTPCSSWSLGYLCPCALGMTNEVKCSQVM